MCRIKELVHENDAQILIFKVDLREVCILHVIEDILLRFFQFITYFMFDLIFDDKKKINAQIILL